MVYANVFGYSITSFGKHIQQLNTYPVHRNLMLKVESPRPGRWIFIQRERCLRSIDTKWAGQLALSAKIRVADHCNDQDQASHGLEDLDWDLHQDQALLQHL
jgi:hypothetical protein